MAPLQQPRSRRYRNEGNADAARAHPAPLTISTAQSSPANQEHKSKDFLTREQRWREAARQNLYPPSLNSPAPRYGHDQRSFLGESAESRLAAAGVELPPAVAPFGDYVPAIRTGNLLFLSGMLPTVGMKLVVSVMLASFVLLVYCWPKPAERNVP